jgi:uncharacterized protein YneF (UPF0154 family)
MKIDIIMLVSVVVGFVAGGVVMYVTRHKYKEQTDDDPHLSKQNDLLMYYLYN